MPTAQSPPRRPNPNPNPDPDPDPHPDPTHTRNDPDPHPDLTHARNVHATGTLPEAPGTTPKAARDLAAACLQLDATDRPSVSALLESDWLRPIGSQDSRQPVFQWLVKEAAAATKAKARAMAAKAIATSAEEAEGAEGGGETLA